METKDWIASEFITDPQPGYTDKTVMGKLSGGRYQYEITLRTDGKWRLFPEQIPSDSIYGATPQECLEKLKTLTNLSKEN